MMRPAIIGETQPMKRSAPEVFLVALLIGLIGVILVVVLLAVALWIIPAKGADQPFDWDRYHARQDACLEADRIAQDCTKGVAFCDELALRQARRTCSAFGPLGDERRP